MADNDSACVDLCPPSVLEAHRAHKARLKRIADNAFKPQPTEINPHLSRPTAREIEAGWEAAAANKAAEIIRDTNAEWRSKRPLSVASIQQSVAEYFFIPWAQLTGPGRRKDLVKARQISIYLADELSKASRIDIGRRTGNRDHTTILHSIARVDHQINTNPHYAVEVDAIRNLILGVAA